MNYLETLICAVIAILIAACSVRSLSPLYEEFADVSDKVQNVQIELNSIDFDAINPFVGLIGLDNIVVD